MSTNHPVTSLDPVASSADRGETLAAAMDGNLTELEQFIRTDSVNTLDSTLTEPSLHKTASSSQTSLTSPDIILLNPDNPILQPSTFHQSTGSLVASLDSAASLRSSLNAGSVMEQSGASAVEAFCASILSNSAAMCPPDDGPPAGSDLMPIAVSTSSTAGTDNLEMLSNQLNLMHQQQQQQPSHAVTTAADSVKLSLNALAIMQPNTTAAAITNFALAQSMDANNGRSIFGETNSLNVTAAALASAASAVFEQQQQQQQQQQALQTQQILNDFAASGLSASSAPVEYIADQTAQLRRYSGDIEQVVSIANNHSQLVNARPRRFSSADQAQMQAEASLSGPPASDTTTTALQSIEENQSKIYEVLENISAQLKPTNLTMCQQTQTHPGGTKLESTSHCTEGTQTDFTPFIHEEFLEIYEDKKNQILMALKNIKETLENGTEPRRRKTGIPRCVLSPAVVGELQETLDSVESLVEEQTAVLDKIVSIEYETIRTSDGSRPSDGNRLPAMKSVWELSTHETAEDDNEDEDDDDEVDDGTTTLRRLSRTELIRKILTYENGVNESGIDASETGSVAAFVEGKSLTCLWANCGQVFDGPTALTEHLDDVHGAQNPKDGYVCLWENCRRHQKPFLKKTRLLNHFKVHSGDKPFPCTVEGCNKRFSRADALKAHLQTHSTWKPFKCEYDGCCRAFYHSRSLQKHLVEVHMRPKRPRLNSVSSTSSMPQKLSSQLTSLHPGQSLLLGPNAQTQPSQIIMNPTHQQICSVLSGQATVPILTTQSIDPMIQAAAATMAPSATSTLPVSIHSPSTMNIGGTIINDFLQPAVKPDQEPTVFQSQLSMAHVDAAVLQQQINAAMVAASTAAAICSSPRLSNHRSSLSQPQHPLAQSQLPQQDSHPSL